MPQYFVTIHDGQPDPEPIGLEMAREMAWRDCLRASGEMLREFDPARPESAEWRMQVTDEGGRPVFTFRFSATDHGGS